MQMFFSIYTPRIAESDSCMDKSVVTLYILLEGLSGLNVYINSFHASFV